MEPHRGKIYLRIHVLVQFIPASGLSCLHFKNQVRNWNQRHIDRPWHRPTILLWWRERSEEQKCEKKLMELPILSICLSYLSFFSSRSLSLPPVYSWVKWAGAGGVDWYLPQSNWAGKVCVSERARKREREMTEAEALALPKCALFPLGY